MLTVELHDFKILLTEQEGIRVHKHANLILLKDKIQINGVALEIHHDLKKKVLVTSMV